MSLCSIAQVHLVHKGQLVHTSEQFKYRSSVCLYPFAPSFHCLVSEMGRIRPSKRESTAPEEGLPEEIGQKLVASVLDEDRFGRFKVLLSRHSKRAVTTFRERETTLSLLQFACLVGNVQAGKCMLLSSALVIRFTFCGVSKHDSCVPKELIHILSWCVCQASVR